MTPAVFAAPESILPTNDLKYLSSIGGTPFPLNLPMRNAFENTSIAPPAPPMMRACAFERPLSIASLTSSL